MPLPAGYERLRTELRKRLSANIKGARRRLGMSQEETAEAVDFSLPYEQRIEGGRVNVPLDTLVRFAAAFGIDPAKLLSRNRVSQGARRKGP
jgi:transcriptional regulator with XRE-family HTH domain